MKKLKLIKHNDPSHGWYAVKRSLLESLGIMDQISSCSYQKGKTVYLEEDSDATKFFIAYVKKMKGVDPSVDEWYGWMETRAELFEVEYKHTNQRSSVRYYSYYKAA